jgi:hypothetical protein
MLTRTIVAAAASLLVATAAYAADIIPSAPIMVAQNKANCDNQDKGKHGNAAIGCDDAAKTAMPAKGTARDAKSGRHAPGNADTGAGGAPAAAPGSSTAPSNAPGGRHGGDTTQKTQ